LHLVGNLFPHINKAMLNALDSMKVHLQCVLYCDSTCWISLV